MRCSLVLALAASCGAPAHPPYVHYRDATNAYELRLSASGQIAAMVVGVGGNEKEIRLRQRVPDNRQLASGPGTIVGTPSERDVLVIDAQYRIRWLREDRTAALDLPHHENWRYLGGTVDHAANIATLAFASLEGGGHAIRVVSIDSATLKARAAVEHAVDLPYSCRATGTGSTLFVWCSAPDEQRDHWNVWRFDGATTTWTVSLDFDDKVTGRHDMLGGITGDASALVLMYGIAETSRIRFDPTLVRIVDARDHSVRTLPATDRLYFLDEMTPVPGKSEVAYIRWLYNDFYGIVVIDTRTATMRVVVPPEDKLGGGVLAIDPEGRFVIP